MKNDILLPLLFSFAVVGDQQKNYAVQEADFIRVKLGYKFWLQFSHQAFQL